MHPLRITTLLAAFWITMKRLLASVAAAVVLVASPAFAQTNQGSSPLSIPKGGTGQANRSAALNALMPTPTRNGDVTYWDSGTSSWKTIAGNNSGTLCLQENSSGVPAWAACAASSGITLGSTSIVGGTSGRLLRNNGGFVDEYALALTSVGGTGASNSTNATGDILSSSSTNGTFAARSLSALCILAPTACGSAFGYVNAAWYGVVCDGVTDTRVALQSAINATPAGGTLYLSAQGASGGCIVSKSASAWALQITQPITLVCDKGVAIQPDSSMGSTSSTNDVLRFVGYSSPYSTTVKNCFIGNGGTATRFGRHAMVFDTTTAGNNFARLKIEGVFTQSGTSGVGYGVYILNNGTNNINGGTYLAQIGDRTSQLGGGVRLEGAGDSITVQGAVSYNGGANADNNGIWVSLVSGAGDLRIHVNLTQPAGLQIRCGYNIDIRGEYELPVALTGVALIDVNGADCTTSRVGVHAQMQAIAGIGTPRLLNVSANVASFVLSESAIATPTPYTPVNNGSASFQLGPNYWSVGGATHIGSTAPANTYGGG